MSGVYPLDIRRVVARSNTVTLRRAPTEQHRVRA
jgi:hypothetical protein